MFLSNHPKDLDNDIALMHSFPPIDRLLIEKHSPESGFATQHCAIPVNATLILTLFLHSPRLCAEYCESNFKNFTDVCVAAGWNLDRLQLTVGHYRCQWSELMEVVD